MVMSYATDFSSQRSAVTTLSLNEEDGETELALIQQQLTVDMYLFPLQKFWWINLS